MRLLAPFIAAALLAGTALAQQKPDDNSVGRAATQPLRDTKIQKDKIPEALREMHRVLAPGGRIVVASLQFSNPVIRFGWMAAHRVVPGLAKRVQPVDFRQFLEDTGLRVLQDEQIPAAAGTRLLTLVKVVG